MRNLRVSPPFTVLVADTGTGRRGFTNQVAITPDTRYSHVSLTGTPSASSGTITIVDASFPVEEIAATGYFVINAPVTTGTTITINGNVLIGIAAPRVSGANNFNVTGSSEAVAADIVAAINDGANAFSGDVVATVSGDKVCLTAVTGGVDGNAVTLATNAPDEVLLASDTLFGGRQTGGASEIHLGPYTLSTGENWAVTVGDATASATSLADAINNLPGYSASSLANVITVEGPPNGDLTFNVWHSSGTINFELSPVDGFLTANGPVVGAPTII